MCDPDAALHYLRQGEVFGLKPALVILAWTQKGEAFIEIGFGAGSRLFNFHYAARGHRD